MNNIFSKKKFVFLFFIGIATTAVGQKTTAWPVKASTFFQGFEVQVSGEVLDFLPGLTNGQVALLARANRDSKPLAFHSSVIPLNYNEPILSLVWSVAISKRLQEPSGAFVLSVNNEPYFTFTSHKDSLSSSWAMKSKESELSFISTEITKGSGDAFGYMFLNIPTSRIKKGERVTIQVAGGDQNSMDWYMPFGIPVVNEQSILAEPALVKTKDGSKQRIRVEIKHAGPPSKIQFRIDGQTIQNADLKPGKKVFYLLNAPVMTPKDVKLQILIDGKTIVDNKVTLRPVRKFEVYFLAHSHVDIGFTHKQDDVEKLQWRNFESAIDLAHKTKDYPDGAQFKWNAEITWAIDGYLKTASEEKRKRFLEAVEKGWIGLDALYGSQLTGLQREEELINNQRYALSLNENYGFKISTAMISDVPGYSWGSVESLAESGVKYFSSGPNHMPHLPHGGYQVGHTLETWGDVPFYWSSASGKKKVLFWMTSHGYSWFHNWSVDILSKAGGDPVVKFLDELEQQKYPYDIVQLRYTVGNDNGPPDETMPDFIKQWNETYEFPKMRIATTQEMFQEFEKRYGSQLPVFKGDFTPYWEDGAASSALETGINRKSADRLVQAETLTAMLDAKQNTITHFDEAWRNVLLFSEHTWGANISKSQPDSEFTKSLWNVKAGFALDAEKQSLRLVEEALKTIQTSGKTIEAFQVINTSSWNRTNLVCLPASWSFEGNSITDDKGKNVDVQRLNTGELAFVAKDIPAFGARKYTTTARSKPVYFAEPLSPTMLSNGSTTIEIDSNTGDLASLRVENGPNLVDQQDTLGFNAYWYGGLIKTNLQKQQGAKFEFVEKGLVLTKVRVTSQAPGAESLVREFQMVRGLDEIYITNVVDKKPIVENENVRFSFPFNIPNSQVRIDIPWATVKPEQDQLKGANKNFYSVQRWVDISNNERGVTLATLEAPLLEIGDMHGQHWMSDMTTRPWIKKYQPSTRLFSWVMNNAWFVNYKASQEGKIPFHYVLKPHGAFNDLETKKFGIEQTQPLLAVPVDRKATPITSILNLKNEANIIVTSLKFSRDGKALMVRLFNPTNEPGTGEVLLKNKKPAMVSESSSQEEKRNVITSQLSLSPWEVKTIRIEL